MQPEPLFQAILVKLPQVSLPCFAGISYHLEEKALPSSQQPRPAFLTDWLQAYTNYRPIGQHRL